MSNDVNPPDDAGGRRSGKCTSACGASRITGRAAESRPLRATRLDRGTVEGEYGVDQMRYMSDLEHVRERSGMYIGNRDVRGLHHLVTEVVDNSIDEVMAGQANVIKVTVNHDGSITVADDGRGIPVKTDASIGCSALEGVMTMLKYGGKFDHKAYKTSGGLHGIGVKAVNFSPSGVRWKFAARVTSINRNTSAASRRIPCRGSVPPRERARRPRSNRTRKCLGN